MAEDSRDDCAMLCSCGTTDKPGTRRKDSVFRMQQQDAGYPFSRGLRCRTVPVPMDTRVSHKASKRAGFGQTMALPRPPGLLELWRQGSWVAQNVECGTLQASGSGGSGRLRVRGLAPRTCAHGTKLRGSSQERPPNGWASHLPRGDFHMRWKDGHSEHRWADWACGDDPPCLQHADNRGGIFTLIF